MSNNQMSHKSANRTIEWLKKTAVLGFIFVMLLSLVNINLVFAQSDFCGGLSNEFAGFLDCSSNFNSFTEFQGGLNQPDAEGYDPSLTESDNLKTYAKNIANFVLGFLGLVAVLIIIYSGFLYVTSRGESEPMEAGKKGILYALIGIVIIFSSYAVVNTILQAPGGDGTNIRQQAGRGGGIEGTNRAQLANFNSAAEEVKKITSDMVRSYQKNYELAQRAQKLTAYAPDEWTRRDDFLDYLRFVRTELVAIRSQAGFSTDTYLAANYIINAVVDPSIVAINRLVIGEERNRLNNTVGENNFYNFFDDFSRDVETFWNTNFGTDEAVKREFECALPAAERSVQSTFVNCDEGNDYVVATLTGAVTGIVAAAITGGLGAGLGGTIAAGGIGVAGGAVGGGVLSEAPGILEINGMADDNSAPLSNSQAGTILDQAIDISITEILIKKGIYSDFAGNTAIYNSRLDDISRNIQAGLGSTNLDKFSEANTALTLSGYQDIFSLNIDGLATSNTAGATFSDQYISKALTSLKDLYEFLVTLKFTAPVIRADAVTGSAPLIVNFDASASYDPANTSIPDANFEWDAFNGASPENIECITPNKNTSTYTCIFKNPGVYNPKLTLKSTSDDIVAGVAYQNISVTAPVAKIKLSAKINDSSTPASVLRQYDNNGNLLIDLNEYSVTLEDARKGILFDASGTDTAVSTTGTSSSGAKTIVRYEWTFNDSNLAVIGSGTSSNDNVNANTNDITVSQNAVSVTRTFNKRGVINASLAVTDTQGNIDRKLFNIRVTDLVARITSKNNLRSGVPNQEFIFDASSSRSDVTPELNYAWEVVNNQNTVIHSVAESKDSAELRYRFTAPGDYTIKLKVSAAGRTSEDSIPIRIESVAPSASLDVIFPDSENQPNLVLIDGSASFRPDVTTENNELEYSWRILNATENNDYTLLTQGVRLNRASTDTAPADTFSANSKLEVAFKKAGNFRVELTVKEPLGKTAKIARDINITSVIDLKFAEDQLFAGQLSTTGDPVSEIQFKLESQNAERAQINFGDNSTPVNVVFNQGVASHTHQFRRAGTFEVTIRATKGSDVNMSRALIVVGNSNNPIAVPKVRIGSATISNLASLPPVYRGTVLSFDARSSLNVNGTNQNLRYEWSFGDGRINTTNLVTNFSYNDLPPVNPGYFTVNLTVTDVNNPSLTDTQSFNIPVQGAKPSLQSIVAKPQLNREETPLNVTVETIGASDRDGKITNYRFYYFPISDPTRQLGVKNVSLNSTTLTINTFGEQNQEVEYGFCVDLTDDEGNEVTCNELFPNANYTKLTVKNGKNDPPRASFTVDRTSIKVGETINFTSTSNDPDGRIIEWTYDFEGDNSFTNDRVWEQGNVSYTYNKKSKADGFRVRLRVLDDKGAMAVSQPITIFVDGILDEPVAAFTDVSQSKTVQFRDKSKADDDNNGTIVKWEWDFDARLDSDGDGNPRNDVDSEEQNPVHTYERSGGYQVILTVTDSEGNEATVTRNIIVQEINPNIRNPYSNAVAVSGDSESALNPFRDIIRSVPTKNAETGVIQLAGESARLTLNFTHLPTNSRRILIDRNIYCDSNGDGARNNDVDISEVYTGRQISIQYSKSEMTSCDGIRTRAELPIRIQVAIEAANGTVYTDQADIIFEGSSLLQANLRFDPNENVPAFIYIGTLIIIIIGSSFLMDKRGTNNNRKLKL